MAQSYKILGQITPVANTLTNVYVTGTSANAIVNTIYICNQDSANANVDLIVRPVNESLDTKHYVIQNQILNPTDTMILNLNITMNESVILAVNNTIRAGETKSCNVSVSAFGVEIV